MSKTDRRNCCGQRRPGETGGTLAKLEWYRLGGDVSERQWRDVLGILKVQGGGLDKAYLDTWASSLGVRDRLDKALREAGIR